MYYDFMVPLPDVKGEITLMKKGDIRYVQLETGRVYLPERKYTIPQRVTIGKLSAEQPARMYPNEKDQDYFPESVLPEERPDAYRSCALRIGTYAVIQNVLNEYRLSEMLKKRIGQDCGLFLDLVSFTIVDKEKISSFLNSNHRNDFILRSNLNHIVLYIVSLNVIRLRYLLYPLSNSISNALVSSKCS